MRISQQYDELIVLREEINKRLRELDFEKIKELLVWLAHSNGFQQLKTRDNQMIMLDCFSNIWIEEKKKLEHLGIHEDIFNGIHSLQDVERKYLLIKYCALRMENGVPEEFCEQAIDDLILEKVSGIAIGKITVFETHRREANMVGIARWLKRKGQAVTAITLLQYGADMYEGNREILLELADSWMEGLQWKQAYDCLKKIKNPTPEEITIIDELEKVI